MKHGAYILIFALLSIIFEDAALGVEPSVLISQYGHVIWRLEDGLSNAAPNAIAQSSDGYIWVGTETGLLRFDGMQFVPWTPPHWDGLSNHEVFVLYAASDGALWIGTPTNLASWKNGVLTIIDTNGSVYVNGVVEDRDHTIWFTTTRRKDGKGVCRVSGTAAKCFGLAEGGPIRYGQSIAANVDGSLTITESGTIASWSPTGGLISKNSAISPSSNPGTTSGIGQAQISAIQTQADGTTLVGFARPGRGQGLQRLSGSSWSPFVKPGFDGATLAIEALYTDRLGALWIGTRNDGLFRVVGDSVDHYDRRAGLSGNAVRDVREDSEGDVWVATDGGIDKFRNLKTVSWSSDQGLPAGHVHFVLATHRNDVLTGIEHTVSLIHDGKVSLFSDVAGFPKGFVNGILEDASGRYWVSVDHDLFICSVTRCVAVKRPDGQSVGSVYSMALSADGSVWALAFDRSLPRQILHFQGDKLVESVGERSFGLRVVSDQATGVWINGQGVITHYANGKKTMIPLTATPDAKSFSVQDDLAVSTQGTVFFTSRNGLWVVKDGKARLANVAAGLPCQDLNGLVFSEQQSLWMRSACGLIEIEAGAIDAWWSRSKSEIHYRLIRPNDGARPSNTVFFPQISAAPDGRIWFGYDSGVQMIDPSHISFNSLAPSVHIQELVADRETLMPVADLKLHPLVRDLEVRYTALSFVAPQSVNFKYMLEGRDSTWQDPGTRRSAFYSDLKPGYYRFRVLAANNDGVWNNTGDSLRFYVTPAWFQTMWFRLLALSLILAAFWILYRWRVFSIADAINSRFNERLDERTRLAREIHDTLLQTVQGSKMVADNALGPDTDEVRMRSALERLSAWLEQAITEGRAAVQALRASALAHNELAEGLGSVLKDHCGGSSTSAALTITGEPRDLHPIVQDELALIAREAIRNVCLHANATELQLVIHFAEDLRLSIKDNGVGIDPGVLASGKAGHFGLQSMRERSDRIHASLEIHSSSNRGTEVVLQVPSRFAYKRNKKQRLSALKPYCISSVSATDEPSSTIEDL